MQIFSWGVFFLSILVRDVFVRERDFVICAGHVCAGRNFPVVCGMRLCGHGIAHFSRDHWIIPNPAQNRGNNPGECPVFSLCTVMFGFESDGVLCTNMIYIRSYRYRLFYVLNTRYLVPGKQYLRLYLVLLYLVPGMYEIYQVRGYIHEPRILS